MHGRCKPLTVLYFPNSETTPNRRGWTFNGRGRDIAAPALDAGAAGRARPDRPQGRKDPDLFVNGRPLSSFGHKQLAADLVEQEVSKTKK